jgi:hypothetical protein
MNPQNKTRSKRFSSQLQKVQRCSLKILLFCRASLAQIRYVLLPMVENRVAGKGQEATLALPQMREAGVGVFVFTSIFPADGSIKLHQQSPTQSHPTLHLLQPAPNHIRYDRVISHCITAFFKMSGASSWLQKMRKGELVELCDSVGYKEYGTPAHLAFLRQIG